MYPHERLLAKKMKDKPFALIGVTSDKDKNKLKSRMKQENITWRSFWNGPMGTSGPISKAWNVRGWPTIYVIDHDGIIRYKNVRGTAMDKAVEDLLKKVVSTTKPVELREFQDDSGEFKIKAKFVKFSNGTVQLEKEDGEVISLPISKLSKDDQTYVRGMVAPSSGGTSGLREFVDSTGKFKIQAKFIKFKDNKVHLQKEDGEIITLSMTKLSKKDQDYVKDLVRNK